jgi:long-chain fatty acid transport protein
MVLSSRIAGQATRSVLPRLFSLCIALAACSLLAASGALAQGFGVYEQGTCAMGRAGTGVASPCGDASSFFFNPAGLTGQPGFTGSVGATLVIAQGGFTDDQTRAETDLDNDPIPVPHLYLNYGVSDRLSVGVGSYVPYGLGTKWPTENFEGRFLGYDSSLESIYVQPTAAYRILENDSFDLSVGGGPIVAFGTVELNQRLDLAGQPVPGAGGATFAQLGIPPGTGFADAGLEGTGTGFGAHLGLQANIGDWLGLGVRYLTPVKITYDGDASFSQQETGLTLSEGNPLGAPAGTPLDAILAGQFDGDGTLTSQGLETEITQPAQIVGGVSLQATPGLQLLVDYTWTGWSSFDAIPLDFEQDALDQEQIENYDDTHAIRLGAEYTLGGQMTDGFTLRGGYSYNTAAAPDETITPLLPESDRNNYTVGLGYQFSPGFGFDLAYQYLDQNDRRGRVTELPENFDSDDVAATNSGLYSFNAHLIGATLTVKL